MALNSNVRGSELRNRGTSRSHAASINQNAADTTQLTQPLDKLKPRDTNQIE